MYISTPSSASLVLEVFTPPSTQLHFIASNKIRWDGEPPPHHHMCQCFWTNEPTPLGVGWIILRYLFGSSVANTSSKSPSLSTIVINVDLFYQRCVSLTIPVWLLMKRPNICADFKLSQLSTLQSYLLIFQWSLSIIVQIFPLWMEKAFILLKYYTER